jgi:hypothetical protein
MPHDLLSLSDDHCVYILPSQLGPWEGFRVEADPHNYATTSAEDLEFKRLVSLGSRMLTTPQPHHPCAASEKLPMVGMCTPL